MKKQNKTTPRRKFLQQTGIAAGTVMGFPAIVRGQNLNSKIRVACIGVGGKGSSDTDNAAREGGEIVALCDVDTNTLGKKAQKYPKAAKFQDFRKMFEKMEGEIDAVTVSTPDHCHGVAGILAMQLGKHAYVQKPLTQTVWEARTMKNLASEKKLATQMGNQGSAEDADAAGRIEAVAQTLLFGFKQDVAIRIAPEGEGTLVDMRSAARNGAHDLGADAERIRRFFRDLDSALRGVGITAE